MDKLSFIILRHVGNEYQNLFWNECYDCMRKFYKHEKIYIIDDHLATIPMSFFNSFRYINCFKFFNSEI